MWHLTVPTVDTSTNLSTLFASLSWDVILTSDTDGWSPLGIYKLTNDNKEPRLWPGGRRDAATWVFNGNLFLFGGLGYGSAPANKYEITFGYLNDLWEFDTSSLQWVRSFVQS